MSDQEDTQAAQTTRGGSTSRGARVRRDDDRGRPWNRRDFIPADDPGWGRCTVKAYEDFPRHIFRLFLLLGIQFRWLLTRGELGRALVTQAEAAIDDAKEHAWMDTYETDRYMLEDVLYRPQSVSKVQRLSATLCIEGLGTAFPLDHKLMQTALLARELARMIAGMETPRGLLIFTSPRSLNFTIPCALSVNFLWKTFCCPSSWPLSGPLLMLHFVPRTTRSSTLLTKKKT
jgi:hypothetical protein